MSELHKKENNASEKEADVLLVAAQPPLAFIRIKGRGSFRVGPALKEFGVTAMANGCKQFLLDMDECIGMDSTFMGVLAGMALRLKKESAGGVFMLNMKPKTKALLETLGLDKLITAYQVGEPLDELKKRLVGFSDLSMLDTSVLPSRKICLERMLEAHENLVKVSADNLPKFKNVMSYLSADLKQFEEP